MTDIASLESSAELWQWVEFAGLFLVLVGVIGESLVEFFNFIKSTFWKPTIGKASALVLVAGLALELISMPKLSEINSRVVAILNKQTADALERAAVAEKGTEEERIARLKLEAQVAPRSLSVKQLKAIGASLKRFKGRNVTVVSLAQDVEAAAFGTQLISALRQEGIVVEDKLLGLSIGGYLPLGIQISGPDTEQDFVKALTDSFFRDGKLTAHNFGTKPVVPVGISILREKAVFIFIGAKPPVILPVK